MVDYYLKIGEEIFKLTQEELINAIKLKIVEKNDQVYSPVATNGLWKKIKELENIRPFLTDTSSKIEYVVDEDIPPLKRELLKRQNDMREVLNKKGIVLKCEKCGETRDVVPSGVYRGKFLCRKCEEYYKIEGVEEETSGEE